MARNEQLIRQHKLLQILERRRYGATLNEIRDTIVDELGLTSLHTRSIRRDIEALQIAGIDIQTEDRPSGKVWRLGERARSGYEISFTAAELMAMALAKDLLMPLSGTVIGQGVSGFWAKVEAGVPAATYQHFEEYRKTFVVSGLPAKSYEEYHGIIKTVQRGILEHRHLEIQYAGPAKKSELRTIAPLGIILDHGSLYVVSNDPALDTDSDFRHWKVDRINKASILDSYFTPPDDFELSKYTEKGIGVFARGESKQYEIKLSERAGAWVSEDPWHPEQSLEQTEEGGYLLTIHAAHDLEVFPRVLALGVDAILLSPNDSRQRLQTALKDIYANYA